MGFLTNTVSIKLSAEAELIESRGLKKPKAFRCCFFGLLLLSCLGPMFPIISVEMCVGGYFPNLMQFLHPVLSLGHGFIPFVFIAVMPKISFFASFLIVFFGKSWYRILGAVFLGINFIVCTIA